MNRENSVEEEYVDLKARLRELEEQGIQHFLNSFSVGQLFKSTSGQVYVLAYYLEELVLKRVLVCTPPYDISGGGFLQITFPIIQELTPVESLVKAFKLDEKSNIPF